VVAGIMMIFNVGLGAVGISTLLGIQVLLTGTALVLFSFAKKALMGKVRDKVDSFKSGF
jgi:uncharacterized membrane protein HdeD (DUF308 family)